MKNLSLITKYLTFIFILSLSANALAAKSVSVPIKAGTLTMKDIIEANKDIANSVSSKFVNKSIPGTIVEMNNRKFEIRFFSFEDTTNKLEVGTTFKDYIIQNNLLDLKSIITNPIDGIIFESFSSRSAKLEDKVYFGIGLRLVESD